MVKITSHETRLQVIRSIHINDKQKFQELGQKGENFLTRSSQLCLKGEEAVASHVHVKLPPRSGHCMNSENSNLLNHNLEVPM